MIDFSCTRGTYIYIYFNFAIAETLLANRMEAQLVFLAVLVASFEFQVVKAIFYPTSGKLTSLQSML